MQIKDQGLYPHRLGLVTARFCKHGGWEEKAEQEDNSTHLSNRLLISIFYLDLVSFQTQLFVRSWFGTDDGLGATGLQS